MKTLLIFTVLGVFALIRFGIGKLWFEATREKLDDEKEKGQYLESKYKHLEQEPRVKGIIVLIPKTKSGNWIVEKMVKKGVFPRDYTVNEFVAEISDWELSQIIQDSKRRQQQKSTKRQIATEKKAIDYFPIDEVSIIISPRVSPKGIVTFYDLAGNRVPGIPKTPKEKALQWKCFLGKKTFKKVQRWVPVNASHVEPHLNDLDFINAHSIKSIKELKSARKESKVSVKSFDFDIDCSHLTKTEFSDTYKSKYGTLTGYGRFKSPTALYIGHYNKGELNGYAEAYQDGKSFKGEWVNDEFVEGEIHKPATKNESEMLEIGRFIEFELDGKGSREFKKGNTRKLWSGLWKNGDIISGECLTETSDKAKSLFHRRKGQWLDYKLHGEGKEIMRLTQGKEIEKQECEGIYENDRLVRGRTKQASYDINRSTKTKKLIALVEVVSTFTNISAVNKKGKYSKLEYAPEPRGEFNLKLMGGRWPHDANIKGEIHDGIVTKITSIQGAASVYMNDQRLVNLSWYDLINNPPLPPKVSQEEMIEETEGMSTLMMFHFPDGSLSHTESGQMINGKFIPDEESLKLRREQFGSDALP